MSEKSYSGAYVHNGKKLFNAILAIFERDEFEPRNILIKALQANVEMVAKGFMNDSTLLTEIDANGFNFLHRTVMSDNNDLNILNTLINIGIDLNVAVNCTGHKDDGKTALRLACEKGHTEIVLKLLEQNANADANPIHIAAKNGHQETLDALLKKYPDAINLCDSDGKTALQLADENGHAAVANYLVEKGAIDHDVNKLKEELRMLTTIIFDGSWATKGKGWGFFGDATHTPHGVRKLRLFLGDVGVNQAENIDELDRNTILALARKLKNHDFKTDKNRHDDTIDLYALVNNMGQNYMANMERKFEYIKSRFHERSESVFDIPIYAPF